ncbi:vacuole membrane protein 1-like [Halichondria panicea]|uniref:vacuole membrane protein 1-like n=1 Tax=Halichondria panicea TaxID=6063 RepID=UPI00312B37F2
MIITINTHGLPHSGVREGMKERKSRNSSTRLQASNNGQPQAATTTTRDPGLEKLRQSQRKDRSKLVLWRRPLTTLHYFTRELLYETSKLVSGVLQHRIKVFLTMLLAIVLVLSYYLDGPHQTTVAIVERELLWWSYWVGLGVLSSVGLGTGLHTFLLYLGPFIASVTLAAFTCNSVDFPDPPYPNDIVCPDTEAGYPISFWTVMSKVRLEAVMWGAGAALGELPPYFMARAARLSDGEEVDDRDYDQIEAVLHSSRKDPLTRAKKAVHRLVQKIGFFGILLCASIPNPLFDLAGITCGHFLVPFWTFFGATLIGKAIIKMHIQQVFVILAFSEHHLEWAVDLIGGIPYAGPLIQAPFSEFLEKQKAHLHRKPGEELVQESSLIQQLFGYLLLVMVVYFVLSIVHSMAQNYAKRTQERELHSRNKHSQ